MRTTKPLILLMTLVLITAGALPVSAIGGTAQGSSPTPAHLVLSIDDGTDAQLNRMDWDVNAWSPVFPGTALRSGDYIELSASTAAVVLCTDLTLLTQRGSEAAQCDPYPYDTFFVFLDDPAWSPDNEASQILVQSTDFPPEVTNPSALPLVQLSDSQRSTIEGQISQINGLGLPDDAAAFAAASLYRGQGLILDAIQTLTTLPDIECTDRRTTVSDPPTDARPLVKSPLLYLRLGELFQIVGQNEDAQRYYLCASDLAERLNDPADAALAYARQANIADPANAVGLYQLSIDRYTALGAAEDASAMLELCGSRSCTQ